MQRRKVSFYSYAEFDGGAYDSPELENPQEQREGYYLDIVTNLINDESSGNLVPRSEVLIELEDGSIISILPKQLIKFLR